MSHLATIRVPDAAQGFEGIRANGCFYVDKTGFVRDWWLAQDDVTLVCRPRRFGKTLNLDTVRCFLSRDFAGRGEELFGGLGVWEDPAMRELQGTVPVVAMSFARVKQSNFEAMCARINELMVSLVEAHAYLYEWSGLSDRDRQGLDSVARDMDAVTCTNVPNMLCRLLRRYHGVAPVVLLDEYDAPMECAWTHGYWDVASDFMRDLMNSTFKTNPAMGRGLITGVTRVSRESIFSDLNNLVVVTTSTPLYQTAFGFTQAEVDAALAEYGLATKRDAVRDWYDGFTFGGIGHIYNPWSMTQLLQFGEFRAYWANTSGNGLVSEVVRRGDEELKADFEELMRGGEVAKPIDEQVVFSELATTPEAVWALLLAAGYVTSSGPVPEFVEITPRSLRLTNREVRLSFDRMVRGWLAPANARYQPARGEPARALLPRPGAGHARLAARALERGVQPRERLRALRRGARAHRRCGRHGPRRGDGVQGVRRLGRGDAGRHRGPRPRTDRREGLRGRPHGARHRPRAHPYLRHRLPRQGGARRVAPQSSHSGRQHPNEIGACGTPRRPFGPGPLRKWSLWHGF